MAKISNSIYNIEVTTYNCHNPNNNATQPQPQHYSWVGHENDFANHPTQTFQPLLDQLES